MGKPETIRTEAIWDIGDINAINSQ